MVISPLNYRGSKAKSISHLIFPKGLFVDVFGGSGVVTMNRQGPRVYNDINSDLVRFMTALRDKPFLLLEQLELYLRSREMWERASLEIPIEYYIKLSDSFGGTADTWGRFLTIKGGSQCLQTKAQKFFLPASYALRGVEIRNQGYKDLMLDLDSKDTIFYLDPPYENLNTSYGKIDHEALLDLIFSLKGFVALSGYPKPMPYPWDDYKEWEVQNFQQSSLKARGKKPIECLWTKNPSLQKESTLSKEST